jgi:hypothetical protein
MRWAVAEAQGRAGNGDLSFCRPTPGKPLKCGSIIRPRTAACPQKAAFRCRRLLFKLEIEKLFNGLAIVPVQDWQGQTS